MTETVDVLHRARRELDRLVPHPADGDRPGLLVALSGGADSTALLLICHDWAVDHDVPLAAAHLHHGLRGPDADVDEAFCRELCAELAVPLTVGRLEPTAGPVSEDALRHDRRRFLTSVIEADVRLGLCVLGHHRNDQAETLLMRLFRGTGPDGFRGMQPRTGAFLRPLLGLGRDDLRRWLEARGRSWREDSSNHDGDNLRAVMRRDLMPVLQTVFGPAADRGPARFAGLIAADAAELDRQADAIRHRWLDHDADRRSLPLADLRDLPAALAGRLVRRMCTDDASGPLTLEASHVEGLLERLGDARSGTVLELSGGWSVHVEFDRLKFRHRDDPPPPSTWALETREASGDEIRNPKPEKGLTSDTNSWSLTCPHEIVQGEPSIRAWRPGERMRPLGLAGHKKISDLLREHRVPLSGRDTVPVVADDDGPLWLVGICRDERTRLLPSTSRGLTLLVDVHPGDEPAVDA